MEKRRNKLSDSELIDYIKERSKELNRTPGRRDLQYYYIILQRFGSLNHALNLAGLTVNRWNELSKKESLKIINDYYDENGSIPGMTNWNKIKDLPRAELLMRPFKYSNWIEFILSIGLPHPITPYKGRGDGHRCEKYSDKELLKIIRMELDRLDSAMLSDYKTHKSIDMPSYDYLASRFKLSSWNEMLVLVGLEDKILYIQNYTQEQLINILKAISIQKDREPVALDIEELNMSSNTFIEHFGSWNNALIAAGFKPLFKAKTEHSEEEMIEMYKDLCDKLGRTATGREIEYNIGINAGVYLIRFGSMGNLAKLAGYETERKYRSKYTKRIVSNLLLEQVKIKGSKLTVKELTNLACESFPAYTTILRCFHTTKITEVWKEIGL